MPNPTYAMRFATVPPNVESVLRRAVQHANPNAVYRHLEHRQLAEASGGVLICSGIILLNLLVTWLLNRRRWRSGEAASIRSVLTGALVSTGVARARCAVG